MGGGWGVVVGDGIKKRRVVRPRGHGNYRGSQGARQNNPGGIAGWGMVRVK